VSFSPTDRTFPFALPFSLKDNLVRAYKGADDSNHWLSDFDFLARKDNNDETRWNISCKKASTYFLSFYLLFEKMSFLDFFVGR
jgi:hypothetical protein